MHANCTHCGGQAVWVINYETALGRETEAACEDCADAREERPGDFRRVPLSEIEVDF